MKNKKKWAEVTKWIFVNLVLYTSVVAPLVYEEASFDFEGNYYLNHHLTSNVGDHTPILKESRALTESAKTTPEDVDSLATLDEGDKGQIASLITTTFQDSLAIPIAKAESGLDPKKESETDHTKDGYVYSLGLFQVNITVHELEGVDCPAAFQGVNGNAVVVNTDIYWKCYRLATDPETNIKKAKEIYDGRGWGAWGVFHNQAYKKFIK